MKKIAALNLFTSLFICLITSCTNSEKANKVALTDEAQNRIQSYSEELIGSINNFEFSIINNSWDYSAFRVRVSEKINKTQRSVLNHIFDDNLRMTIKSGNLSIVHRINSEKGHVSLIRLKHFEYYSELTLLLTYDGYFNFFKYRIEFIQNSPKLTDYYDYSENLWYSEKIKSVLELNSKYIAHSPERRQANLALDQSRLALQAGDTLEALYLLYDIPDSHSKGNSLSLRKLGLAVTLGDSIFSDVLFTEFDRNQSTFMKYLYHYYESDTTNLKLTINLLSKQLGGSSKLDSLFEQGYLWNIK
ncbi:hypothetical protein [Roseivirga sp.]|uniref:hypothetical protein n=1 Tax=Roseivirga sp. TaxID=1964215 RepID=UPI003B8C01A0